MVEDLAVNARLRASRQRLLLHPRLRRRRTRLGGRGRRERRGRARRRTATRSPRAADPRGGCARRTRDRLRRVLGPADRDAPDRRRHRHEREDDDRLSPALDPRGRGPPARPLGDDRDPDRLGARAVTSVDRRWRSTSRAPSARCSTPETSAARSRRRRTTPTCGDSTVSASRRSSSRTSATTISTYHGTFEGISQRSGGSSWRELARRDQRRRRVRPTAPRGASRARSRATAHVRAVTDGGRLAGGARAVRRRRTTPRRRSRAADARSSEPSTSRTSWRRSQAPACSGVPDDAIAAGIERPRERPRPHGARRRGAAVLGLRRLRAQAGGPRSRPRGPRGRSPRGACCACSAAAATATAGSGR